MFHAFSATHTLAVSHPLILLVIVYGSWRAVRSVRPPVRPAESRLMFAAAAISLVTYFLILVWYSTTPTFYDHIEPSVVAISAGLRRGIDPYPTGQASNYLGLPYGPLLFEIHAAVLSFSASVLAVKLLSSAAALTSVGAVYTRAARFGSTRQALSAAALVSTGYMAFGPMSFWVRAEPLLCVIAAASLTVADRRGWFWAMTLGLLSGAAFSVKATGPLYVLPAWVVMIDDGRPARLRTATAAAGFCLVSAFTFMPEHIGTMGYLAVIEATSKHGLRLRSIPSQVEWAVLLCVFAMGLSMHEDNSSRRRPQALPRLALLISAALLVPIASKPGAGSYHFIPLVPVAISLGMEGQFRCERYRLGFATLALLACLSQALLAFVPLLAIAGFGTQ